MVLNPICFKGLFQFIIDLVLTNNKQSFIKSDVYETGISDHHKKMIYLVLRKTLATGKPKTVFYCFYKESD